MQQLKDKQQLTKHNIENERLSDTEHHQEGKTSHNLERIANHIADEIIMMKIRFQLCFVVK